MKVAADSAADTMPTTNSTGDSVAMRRSSAMRYSGLLVVALDQVELIVAAVGEPAIDHVAAEPAAPAALRRHAQVDQHDPGRHARHRQQREDHGLEADDARVLLLERIEDGAVPHGELVLDDDLHDDRDEQRAGEEPGGALVGAAPELPGALPEPPEQVAPLHVLVGFVLLVLVIGSLSLMPTYPSRQPRRECNTQVDLRLAVRLPSRDSPRTTFRQVGTP